MINERLVLEGFLSYKKQQVIDFPSIPVCLVNGAINSDLSLSNGAGKSSLFESIPVCAFGKIGGRGEKLDDYINDGMDKMSIEHIFRIDGARYKVRFLRNRGSSTVKDVFYDTNGGTIDEAEWKKTDRTLEEIFGLSFTTYNSTIYLNEKDALKFIDGTSTDRKEILRELLNLKPYEAASKAANKKASEFENKLALGRSLVENKQQSLEDEEKCRAEMKQLEAENKHVKRDIARIEKRIAELEKKKKSIAAAIEKQDSLIEQMKRDIKACEQHQNTVDEKNDKLEKLRNTYREMSEKVDSEFAELEKVTEKRVGLEKQVKQTKKKLKDKSKLVKEHEAIESRLDKNQKDLVEKEKERSTLQTQVDSLRSVVRKIEKFGSACPVTDEVCPVLDDSYKEKFVGDRNKQLEELKGRLRVVDEAVGVVNGDISKDRKRRNEINSEIEEQDELVAVVGETEREIVKLEGNEKKLEISIEKNNERLDELTEYGGDLKNEIEKLTSELEKLKEQLAENEKKMDSDLENEIEEVNDQIESENDEKDGYEKVYGSNRESIAVLNEKLRVNDETKKQIEELLEKNESYVQKKKTFLELVKVFGKDGIQKEVMRQIIPFLEASALELLKVFNNDSERIRVKFDLDPKRADGELKKGGGLDILVVEENKEPKDLRMYSGGERVRLIFSIVLGLARLLSKRSGKKHETLIIDEKIAKLDRKGIEQFVEVINIITKWYKQIYIITHIESLKDMFTDGEILVNKTEEGSMVTVN